MSYAVTDGERDKAINGLDVSDVLDISSNLNTSPTAKQKVCADVNQDGSINGLDVSDVLDWSSQLNNSAGTAVLRDATKSNPFDGTSGADKLIAITAGNNMNFDAYILGDMNGSYADVLAGG